MGISDRNWKPDHWMTKTTQETTRSHALSSPEKAG